MDDLSARLRMHRRGWFINGAILIPLDSVHDLMHEAADALDSLTRERDELLVHRKQYADLHRLVVVERDELAATVERLTEAAERALPWLDYLLSHHGVDWSPPEEAVLLDDLDFVRDLVRGLAADTEEVGDRGE